MEKVTITFTQSEYLDLLFAVRLYNNRCIDEYLKCTASYSKVANSFELLNKVCKIEKEGA